MKASDLRQKDIADLEKELSELRREQFNLRMQKATAQLGPTHNIKTNRRNVARVKTILNEKYKGLVQ